MLDDFLILIKYFELKYLYWPTVSLSLKVLYVFPVWVPEGSCFCDPGYGSKSDCSGGKFTFKDTNGFHFMYRNPLFLHYKKTYVILGVPK